MIAGTPVLCIASSTSSGGALTNTTTATSILGNNGIGTLPGGMLQNGSMIRLTVRGIISCLASATIQLNPQIGGVAMIQTITTPALTVSTNATFELVYEMRISAMSSTAAQFSGSMRGTSTAFGASGNALVPATGAPTAGTAFDPTISNRLDLVATWGAASASNSITVFSSIWELFQ